MEVTWTPTSLATAIGALRRRRGDSTTIEVKSARHGVPDLAPTLCAFANMPDGGTIVLGLDERRGFTPVRLHDLALLEQGVADVARTAVTPPVTCSFRTLPFEGSEVLVCEVAGLPLRDRPARHDGRAYLRQSDGDYAMSEQEITQIELAKSQAQRPHPDQDAVPGAGREHLDPDATAQFLRAAAASSRRLSGLPEDEVLRRTGVVSTGGELTLAGLYALGAYPQQFRPSLAITAAVRLPRSSGGRVRDLAHLDGPLPDLLDDALTWIARNTRTTMGYDATGRGEDRPEFPPVAVREFIANALVHRSLEPVTDSKRVEIRLHGDRLAITSPGGLWGVARGELGEPGGKSAVNVALYDVCQLVRASDGSRVIEGEGGGIREARRALADAGLAPPTFIDRGVSFTVILWRPGFDGVGAIPDGGLPTDVGHAAGHSPAEEALVEALRERGVVVGSRGPGRNADLIWSALAEPRTARELSDALSLSRRQVEYALARLRDAGVVVLDGRPGATNARYSRVTE